MMRFVLICLGGAVGTGARYLLTGWIAKLLGSAFPYGTLTVNVVGSFLIALVMTLAMEAALISPTTRLALTTGVMGGFTTYSAFAYESLTRLQHKAWFEAALYMGLTLGACLVACLLGVLLARQWLNG